MQAHASGCSGRMRGRHGLAAYLLLDEAKALPVAPKLGQRVTKARMRQRQVEVAWKSTHDVGRVDAAR
jgi:hypothetical protein